MLRNNEVSDKALQKTVNQRLGRSGTGSQTRLSVIVQRGTVTLTGVLQYESQRATIVRAVSNIPGMHHIVDMLRVGAKRTS